MFVKRNFGAIICKFIKQEMCWLLKLVTRELAIFAVIFGPMIPLYLVRVVAICYYYNDLSITGVVCCILSLGLAFKHFPVNIPRF